MTKDQFIATLIVMKFKSNNTHRFMRDKDIITLYSHSAVTTLNGISNFHSSYKEAIVRLSETTND